MNQVNGCSSCILLREKNKNRNGLLIILTGLMIILTMSIVFARKNIVEELRKIPNNIFVPNSVSPNGRYLIYMNVRRPVPDVNERTVLVIQCVNGKYLFDEGTVGANVSGVAWSQDSKKAVVAMYDGLGWIGRFVIFSISDKSAELVIDLNSKDFDAQWLSCFSPSFSPDNKKIVFSVKTRKEKNLQSSSIYTINVDGSNLTALTKTEVNACVPVWSVDGGKIIYVISDDEIYDPVMLGQSGKGQIWSMNTDGTGNKFVIKGSEPGKTTKLESDVPEGKNLVVDYLTTAELQYEGGIQKQNIYAALNDILYLSEQEIRHKRYKDYNGKEEQWDLPTLIYRHFVPSQQGKTLGNNFYRDIKLEDVREQVENIIDKMRQTIEISPAEAEKIIKSRANEVILSIKNRNMEKMADFVHPNKGVRFSPYSCIETGVDVVFMASQIKSIFNDQTKHEWGSYDGSGEPIKLTFKEYFDKFIYDQDFAKAKEIGYNRIIATGNTVNNVFIVYPEAIVVEYHFPSFNPEYLGHDWKSLRLIFEKKDEIWYIVGVGHDQLTM